MRNSFIYFVLGFRGHSGLNWSKSLFVNPNCISYICAGRKTLEPCVELGYSPSFSTRFLLFSAGRIYRHFPTRAKLLLNCRDRAFEICYPLQAKTQPIRIPHSIEWSGESISFKGVRGLICFADLLPSVSYSLE